MDVGEWLKELGLGQYASAFADNDMILPCSAS
jgi:SAM domain (Sterile alpha motif)